MRMREEFWMPSAGFLETDDVSSKLNIPISAK